MSCDAIEFIENGLRDDEFGGYYPIVDCEGKSRICTDKRISDQISAALMYVDKGDSNNAEFALNALDKLYRNDHGGFVELTDRYWNPQAPGMARTLHLQIDAARAYALYAYEFNRNVYLEKLVELQDRLQSLVEHQRLATIYSSDWNTPLSYESGIELEISAVNFISVQKKTGVYVHNETLDALKENLKDRLYASNNAFHPRGFYSCELRARSVLAIADLAIEEHDYELLDTARAFLLDTIKKYRDVRYGGYWDRADIHGRVRVEWKLPYETNESPFPIKRALDAGLLLKAMYACRCEEDSIEQDILESIRNFHDSESGGYFLGMGYFWSTPEDPTVPFLRQFWATPKHPGVFWIGNLSYLPLHLKALETQVACSSITESKLVSQKTREVVMICDEFQDYELDGSVDEIYAGTLPSIPVNVRKYRNWLELASVKKSIPYGLTAEMAPLGFRADRAWQVFSTLHVISDLRALQFPIPFSADLSKSILACQNDDGGFSEQPGQLSDIFATYCACISLLILNDAPSFPDACVDYIKRCHNDDGGYGNVPGLRSDIWHTNLAVLSLHALGVEPDEKSRVLGFVSDCRTACGGFSNMPGLPPDTFSTYRAMSTISVLGRKLVDSALTSNWLRNLQDSSGPFRYRPGHAYSLVGTYMAIAALCLLDSEPKFTSELKRWIGLHQKEDGGFGPLGTTSATTDEGFVCVQSLLILERYLSKYWVSVVN